MHNPYIFLRYLIGLDILSMVFGVVIPAFYGTSLIEYVQELWAVDDMAAAWDGWLWLTQMAIFAVAWPGLLCYRRWARILYCLPLALGLVQAALWGVYGAHPGYGAMVVYFVQVYYGFVIAMLFLGPVAICFRPRPEKMSTPPAIGE